MKKPFTFLLIAVIPAFIMAQSTAEKFPKNTIVVTPFGDLINNSKSSFYFKHEFERDSIKRTQFRIGTELINSVTPKNQLPELEEFKSGNLKLGIEFSWTLSKNLSLYAGPELSFTRYRTRDATIAPTNHSIFTTNAIETEASPYNTISKMSIVSLIGFWGINYHLSSHFQVGLESAMGSGWYKVTSRKEYTFNQPTTEEENGVIREFTASRFIFIGYSF